MPMQRPSTRRRYFFLTLAAIVLIMALLYLAWSTLAGRRGEQRLVAQVLTAQGETLIRAVEAGGRVGMRGPGARSFRLRFLLDELASQEDVRFVAIISPDGSLEAQSQIAAPLAQSTLSSLFPAEEPTWALATNASEPLFVVFRAYRPLLHIHHASPFAQALRAPMCALPPRQNQVRPFAGAGDQPLAVVAVGLDASPYVQARRTDIMGLGLAALLLLIVGAMAAAIWFWRRNALLLEQRVLQAEHLAAVGSLAAGVAHEIRNPLSSIKGFATVFQGKFPATSPEHDLAALMIGEVERLNRTVSGLLELSRTEDLHRVELNAGELLDHALKLVSADCQTAGIRVRHALPAVPVRIVADRDRLLQVLLNMLLNAIQAMPHGGQLFVAIRQTGKKLRFHVADTGPGISSEILAHIFDPYFTTRHQGTGLGLALARKIMAAHDGTIFVASTSTQGTEIVAELPFGGQA